MVKDTYWYTTWKDGEMDPQRLTEVSNYKHRVEFSGQTKNHHTLTIKNLTEIDSANYKFRFHTNQEGRKVSGYPGVQIKVTGRLLTKSLIFKDKRYILFS